MPRAAAAGGKKRAAPKNVKLSEQFPNGTLMNDVFKKQWRLGDVIGQGGFGLVYYANSADYSTTTASNAEYVIKIEPGGNGPLFCEMNFYIRAAKKESIQSFITSHRLKYLAIPPYIGHGFHTFNSVSNRFLVMPRYGTDLQKLLVTSGGKFSSVTAFAVGIRMIDALQYLHEKEYVHADIKASNILLGYSGHAENKNQVYLADYGLAYKYMSSDRHKEYKVDPRSAHNGSIEFTSRDAHLGVFPSRRGDLEILGYCLLQWLCGKLPWETNLTNPNFVAQKKDECMADVDSFIQTCFPGAATNSSDCMRQYLQEVNKLDYEDEPNYRKFKDLLKSGLNKSGQKDEWEIQFPSESKTKKRKSTGAESASASPKKPKSAPKKPPAKTTAKSPRSRVLTAESPIVSPKKPKAAAKKSTPKTTAKSPLSRAVVSPLKQKVSPKKRTLITNGKTTVPAGMSSSRSPTLSSRGRKTFEDSKTHKTYQIPPPSKPAPKKSPATARTTAAKSKTVRRVKRTNVIRTDVSIQTTPGLKRNV